MEAASARMAARDRFGVMGDPGPSTLQRYIQQACSPENFEPNLALNYTVAGVKFTPKIYYDLRLKGPTYELTVAYTVPLTEAKSELDFTATAGTFKWTSAAPDQVNSLGQPADVKNWGNYWLVGVSAPYQVTKDSKLSLSLAYTKGSDNFFKTGTDGKVANTAAVGRGVISISYAITF